MAKTALKTKSKEQAASKSSKVWLEKSPLTGYVIQMTPEDGGEPTTHRFENMWDAIEFATS